MTDPTGADSIAGNAPAHVKRALSGANLKAFFTNLLVDKTQSSRFGAALQERIKVTEISVAQKAAEPKQMEGKVVIELEVTEDMLDSGAVVHGGCIAALVDMYSSLALHVLLLSTSTSDDEYVITVSQTMNVMFHSPAELGDMLRLVNTTIAIGDSAHSAATEIWNVTKHRLVASGSQIKMAPSALVNARM